jgi:hypothetical protein
MQLQHRLPGAWTWSRLLGALWLCCLLASGSAQAGHPCEAKEPDANTVLQALELAQKSFIALDKTGAQVAMIARVGQDLSKYHLRYSHMGFVWRDHPAGRWTVVHELNQCGTAESALYNEGLGNFFLDDLFAFETLIIIPNPAVQHRLAAMLESSMPLQLHADHYNMLAYPFSTRYQNSNQWLLEVFAAANDVRIRDRAQAQNWLKLADYQPITLEIPTLTRLGARLFRANVEFDDHPVERRIAGQIDTVTVESVVGFLARRDPQLQEMTLTLH